MYLLVLPLCGEQFEPAWFVILIRLQACSELFKHGDGVLSCPRMWHCDDRSIRVPYMIHEFIVGSAAHDHFRLNNGQLFSQQHSAYIGIGKGSILALCLVLDNVQ